MKHPNRDEWVPYVFGEARADEAKRLREHLESCAECAGEITAWRRSLQTLDRWELPEPVRSRAVVAPVFRWAMAAALVLAAGIAVGRMTAPDAQAMRAEVEASVKAAFGAEMEKTVAEAEARVAEASHEQAKELWKVFSQRLAAAREEDWQTMEALLERQQRAEEGRYVELRRDLETLAFRADEEIRHANFKLTQLAENVP